MLHLQVHAACSGGDQVCIATAQYFIILLACEFRLDIDIGSAHCGTIHSSPIYYERMSGVLAYSTDRRLTKSTLPCQNTLMTHLWAWSLAWLQ